MGCESEYSTPSNTDALVFSTDTLSFDTLFVGDKSETYALKLYNRSKKNVIIDQILLEGGEDSYYSISIDGNNVPSLSEIELASKDSLYIFIEIKCPIISEDYCDITDKVTLRVGSQTKSTYITTFVQNVIVLDNVTIKQNTILNSHIPYRIFGQLTVKDNATLTIAPGTKIYMADKSSMSIEGSLVANGELNNRISIHGDRLTSFYDNIPSQWETINIKEKGHAYFSCVDIANAKSALQIDSTAVVDIDGCILRDASDNLINSRFSSLTVLNSLLYNCGKAIIEDQSSDISIIHCTLSNHYIWEYRNAPSLRLLPYDDKYGDILIANSIIEGSMKNEFQCDSESLRVDHCAISKEITDIVENDSRYSNVISTRKINFVGVKEYDYHLGPESEAIGKGNSKYLIFCPTDFEGNTRTETSPSIGAYEYPTFDNKNE